MAWLGWPRPKQESLQCARSVWGQFKTKNEGSEHRTMKEGTAEDVV